MVYRTRTYIAGEWDGDQDAIQRLHAWNDSKHLNLSFTDAHELTQARDGSLNCSIKSSLATRFNSSKTFVLIVGKNTKSARSGRCQYCDSYNSYTGSCARRYSVDNRSYIEYECDKAINDGLNIVVLYNAATVDKSKCPESIKNIGKHVAMCYYKEGDYYWDYNAVKSALD
ncbi:TIR domain-containing protein [Aeromonas allosaccharophila]|uniref:TIR domain-containing protein n=1 Tax=Aeromonas allosaccharophila TaxID=656 RepID=UPI003D2259C9